MKEQSRKAPLACLTDGLDGRTELKKLIINQKLKIIMKGIGYIESSENNSKPKAVSLSPDKNRIPQHGRSLALDFNN